MLVTWQLSNEIKWPLLQGTPTDYCTPHYIVQLPTIHSASPISIYPLLRGISPIVRYTPLLRGIPPITRYTPYCKVYPLLRGIPPITRYTPYCEVYPLLQGIPLIARYTPYCKIYMYYCSQNIPPISKHTPYYKVANFDTNYTSYVPTLELHLDSSCKADTDEKRYMSNRCAV